MEYSSSSSSSSTSSFSTSSSSSSSTSSSSSIDKSSHIISHSQPPSQCVPIADYTPTSDWKNQEIKSCIKNNNYQYINLIPFRDLTAPLYSMHITPPEISGGWEISGHENNHHNSRLVDCTHYCYFPQMWESIWTTMSYFILSHSNSNSNANNNVNIGYNGSVTRKKRLYV